MKTPVYKKLIAFLLCVMMVFTMMPTIVMAETTEETPPTTEEEIVTPDDGDAEEDETDIYAEAVSVSTSAQLATALDNETRAIRIVADFQLDQTFYVISDTVIYSEEAHTLTRSPDFSGDIFVVGQYEDGTVCEGEVDLQMGHEESETADLLTIDGNRDNMTAEVVGTVFFGCSNSDINLYPNLTVKNCKKVNNQRTLDEAYGLSYTDRIGGAVAIVAGGSMDIYGGTYTNNSVNDEGTDEETALVSTQGGAFYFFGPARIYGGTFSGNHAHRGGAFYVYRTLSIYGGTVKENTASDRGGAVYMPASTLCYLYIEGDEDERGIVLFKDNHADVYGGALYCQGVLVDIQLANFDGNTAGNNGGAVYCIINGSEETDARFTAINTTFQNNKTDYNGGAVYLTGTHAYFENATFNGNHASATANNSGTRYGGGAVYSTGSYVEINVAEFKNNTSDNYGGGLEAHSSSKLVLNKITTSGNSSVANGGFLFANNSAVELYNSAIRANQTDGNGAAAHITNSATLHAYVTTFENNTAVGNGGALYIYTGAVTSLLHSCVFLENTSGNYGGAMYVSNKSILETYNLSAKGNSAVRGGFMYETTTATTVTLNGLTVSGNTASDGGPIIWGNTTAAILYLNKTNYIDVDSTAALDDAYWASAIANKLTVEETTAAIPGFINYGDTEETPPESIVNPNITNVIELQAALAAELREITIISDFTLDRTFYITGDITIYASGNRTLTRSSDFGGDLFVIGQNADGALCEEAVSVTVEPLAESTLTIDGNSANMTADVVGTVFFVCEPGHLELHDGINVTNCKKVGNQRTLDELHGLSYTDEIGGAVAIIAGGTMDIYGGSYYNNSVNDESDSSATSSRGGVIYAFGNVNIYGGSFTDNHAHRGGVFYVYRTMNIHNALIQNNTAYLGGAVYVPASTVAYLYIGSPSSIADSDVKFLSNSAYNGGAIYDGGKLLQIENAQFEGNTSTAHGGAAYVNAQAESSEDVKVIIKDTTFKENTSGSNGGAVYLNSTCAYIHNVNFISNQSTATSYGGGAIYSTGSFSKLEGVRFTNNHSGYNGGAMALYSSSEATLYNISASGNTADGYGGFIYNNSTLNMYNSTVKNSSSAKNGGALYLTGSAVTNIYATDFIGNHAVNGGALHVYTGTDATLVQDCRFTENSADNFGGAVYVNNASSLKLYDITATKNSAGSGGFMYETTKGSVVTVNGLTVSGNTDTNGGPIIWGNTTNAKLYINKTNYTDLDISSKPDDSYWAAAIYNKLTVVEITDAIPEYDEYGNESYENMTDYVSVSNADELEKALADKAERIRIVADFTLDRTFYITSDVTIFSSTPYRLTRAADFGGDLFVVGEATDGSSCLIGGVTPKLTLGNPQSETKDLLVIDGNRYNMTVDVVGSVLFVCNSAKADIYHNASIVNAKKLGNERTLFERYTLSHPTRIGGAALILESGIVNIHGASFRGNAVNQETISEELGEDGRISTLGGAIFSQGDINMHSGTFEHNKAARGGVIYNYRMTHVYSGSFLNNHATTSGGAFYLPSSEYAVAYIGGTSGETKVTFQNNSAAASGGAIYSSALGTTILYGDTVFEGNRNQSANGGAIYASGVLTADNITFRENNAYSKGGAVYLSNTSNDRVVRLSRFNNCTFENNTANKGGAATVYASSSNFDKGANATFTDCTFLGNKGVTRVGSTSSSVGHGGAVYATYRSTVTLNNSNLQNNFASAEGGAMYIAYESKVTVNGSTFTTNSTGTANNGYGGAISIHSSYLNIDGTQFTGNTSLLRGGAIYISYNSARTTDSQVKITNSTFTENTCASLGGAIYSTDRLISPGVDEEGNPLPKEDNNTLNLIMLNTELIGNTADTKGGAVYLTNYSHSYMRDVAFRQNKALGEASGHNAGALYCSGSSTFELNGAEFTENTAGANGGAIGMYTSSSAVMNNVTANGNVATNSAGFMICDTAYATIYNSTIENNTAGYTAGAISTVDMATIHAYNTIFKGNSAVREGGAIYLYAGAVTSLLQDCTFLQNHSDANGGAMYVSKSSILEAYNLIAESNSANKGGFMYETTTATTVTLNGLTVSGNTAIEGGPIIWGNTTNATLYIHKGNYTDTETQTLDDAYWAAAIYNLLTVEEITDSIPEAPTYTDSYKTETESPAKEYDEVDVDHIFYLAENGSNDAINSTYGALPKLDSSSNFMSKNTTEFTNINGTDVTVDTFVYHENDVADNCNVGEGLLIYQAMCYKRAHPEEDVKISLSSFRLSVPAGICIDRNSRYFGYMRPLYGKNYDDYGFVRISYLLVCAASMGIDVTVIGQLDGNPNSSSDPRFEEYFTQMLKHPCDSAYASGSVIGDYMTFRACKWTSYNNKAATDMMHTKLCAVSHYLDKDGNTHRNAVWTSSSNLDGVSNKGTNGVNKLQTATLISDHAEIYRISANYLNLISQYCVQEDVYIFRDIAIQRSTQQIDLLNEGRKDEIPADQQIVYLGSENDNVFELYFAPFGGDLSVWDETYNPFTKQLRALQNSEDSIILTWNNVKFVNYSLRSQMEQVIIDAFHKNANPNNKIYVNLPTFDESAFSDLTVGEDIGYKSFNKFEYGDIHTKDLQVSYVQNGQRYYVSLLNSMNIHGGSMAYQSNFALVIKETDCDEDSVFFTIADETTTGIVSHSYSDEVLEYIPDTVEDGYSYHPCTNCDQKQIIDIIHKSSDWIAVKEATKEQNGIAHKSCLACGLLLESREFEFAGDEVVMDLKQSGGKTFCAATDSENTLQLDSTPYTIEATIQLDTSFSKRGGVIVGNYDNSTNNQLNLEVYNLGQLRLFSVNNGKRMNHYFSTDIRSDVPIHIALTVEGRTAKLYVDGQLKETAQLPNELPDVSGEFRIGGDMRKGNTQYFKGTIYNVSLFDDVRTDNEILEDAIAVFPNEDGLLASKYFTETTETDEITEISNVVAPTGKTFTAADVTDIGTLSAVPLTIEATVHIPESQTARAGTIIGNYDGVAAPRLNLEVYTNGQLRLYVHNGTTSDTYLFPTDIRSDAPVHVALTVDGLTATLYVNGEASSTQTLNFALPEVKENFRIGGDHRDGNSQYFKGTIYNVSMFGSVRTADEVKQDMVLVSEDTENLIFSRHFTTNEFKTSTDGGLTFSEDNIRKIGNLASTPKTLEAIVQVDKSVSDRAGVIVGNYDALRHELMNLEIYSEGRVRLYYAATNGTRADCTFDTDIRSDEAVHIAVTVEDLTATLYINGVKTEQKELPFAVPSITKDFRIGGDKRRGNTQYFKGTIYSVALFSDVRTLEEINTDMSGVNADAENILFTEDFTSIEAPEPTAIIATGMQFSQENSISAGNLASTPNTLEAIVQVDKSVSDRAGVIVGNYDALRHELMNLEIYSEGRVRLYYAATNGTRADCTFDTDIRSDKAVHIAVTVEDLTATLYINGVKTEQKELPFAVPSITKDFRIGGDKRKENTQYFKGTIYSVNLFSDVRTGEQIKNDLITTNITDTSLLYSIMFAADECTKLGHTESDWIQDISDSNVNNSISHTECTKCGKMLQCKKLPKVSSVVKHLVFKNAQGLNPSAQSNGYSIEDEFTSGPLTFEALIQLDKSYNQRAGVIMGNYDGSTADQINLEAYTNGKLRLYYKVDKVAYTRTFRTDIRSDSPTHISLTVDGLTAKLYVNGKLAETATLKAELPQIVKGFKIGCDNRTSNPQYFKGTIYTAYMFGDVRTAEEIAVDRFLPPSNSDNVLFSKSFLNAE